MLFFKLIGTFYFEFITFYFFEGIFLQLNPSKIEEPKSGSIPQPVSWIDIFK